MKSERIKFQVNVDGGGRIENLEIGGIKILGTYQRIDGKTGNTHVCTPNFGDELSEFNLPFHGPSRNGKWKIIRDENNLMEIEYLMKNEGLYPTDLKISQIFEIRGEEFFQTVRVKNIGEIIAPVNIAIHYYFDMPLGFENLKINGELVKEIVMTDSGVKAMEINKIDDGKRIIIMKTKNVEGLHLWSGGNEKFCCIEPVMGMRDLNKNEEIEMTIGLRG